MAGGKSVNLVVEGKLDEAVLSRLLSDAGICVGRVHGKRGKNYIFDKIRAFNQASRHGALWLALVDLDRDEACAPALVGKKLPAPEPAMIFRVAVREIEAWLMADRKGMAAFLGVAESRIADKVEDLDDPKLELINLARKSRKRGIKNGMVPRAGGGASEGELYNEYLIEYVMGTWQPARARKRSDSLDRLMRRIEKIES